ncbi:MAG: hypothetical protein REJ23_06445 [Brevundimonas sp.]|nr:hypothetical protein [Brevundimonas sp.]
MRGLEGAVRVRCPECCEADWRTRIELDSGRPFTCYMCLCRSPKPLLARGIRDGCSSRLSSVSRRVRGLFRRRDGEDGAVV